ncbi:MAG TPA: serine hydrolase [Candidatus Paceibacterota bacterium]|nr:serine hydrolase [Candidatus Paceibacterota bacterium]
MTKGLAVKALWLAIGVAGGLTIALTYLNTQAVADQDCLKKYSLTVSTVDCGQYEESLGKINALDQIFNEKTAQYVREGKAQRVSVWVRDLTTRQWAASNEFETYSPASLLKLPLAIAYYKFSELDHELLNRSITYEPQTGDEELLEFSHFTKGTTLTPGQSYQVSELIERTLVYSDNAAALALYRRMDPAFYKQVLLELGIEVPADEGTINYINVKSYANIYRILYNASYLHRDHSQKILEILTRTTFKGIAEPIPSSVTVAHKFGERTVSTKDKQVLSQQLLDCGIVYKNDGNNPYTICIMTEGKDVEALLSIIKEISKFAYEYL